MIPTIQSDNANLLYLAGLSGNGELIQYLISEKGMSPDITLLNAVYLSGNQDCLCQVGKYFIENRDPNILKDWMQFVYAHICNRSLLWMPNYSAFFDNVTKTYGNELISFYRQMGSLMLFHAILKVDPLTHELKVQRTWKQGGSIITVEEYLATAFFSIHALFIYKNQDRSYQIALNSFWELIKILKGVSHEQYQNVVSNWVIPEEIKNHKLGKRMKLLKSIDKETLQEVVPQYLENLRDPAFLMKGNRGNEERLIERINGQALPFDELRASLSDGLISYFGAKK